VPFIFDHYHKFLAEAIARCNQTLLLFFDQQLGPQLLGAHKTVGGRKKVVVLFQGGDSDREVLRIAKRFFQHDDLLLDVFLIEKPGEVPTKSAEDDEALSEFEKMTKAPSQAERTSFHRVHDRGGSVDLILEKYKQDSPHLIIMGCSEGPQSSMAPGNDGGKRASVPEGADRVFSKALLMGQMGKALSRMEIESSLLLVLSRQSGTRSAKGLRAELQPLGLEMEYSTVSSPGRVRSGDDLKDNL